MTKLLLDLQMFAEGGAGGAGASAGGTAGAMSGAEGAHNGGSGATAGDDLSNVIYGRSMQNVADSNTDTNAAKVSQEDKAKAFEELIKKGGEYAEEFNKRTQSIIDKRFKQTKEMEAKLKSHDSIMDVLSKKYGVDAQDADAILKAIDEDDSLYEQAAFEEGLTVKQYREKLTLERENANLKAAEEERKRRSNADAIYADWLNQAEALKNKYGLDGFDLATELNSNPQMVALLQNPGVDFEAAYMATHFDQILGGAMAHTAKVTEQKVANRVAARQSRPNELGTSSMSTNVFKSDVNALTNADIDEVLKRVRRGEKITFG